MRITKDYFKTNEGLLTNNDTKLASIKLLVYNSLKKSKQDTAHTICPHLVIRCWQHLIKEDKSRANCNCKQLAKWLFLYHPLSLGSSTVDLLAQPLSKEEINRKHRFPMSTAKLVQKRFVYCSRTMLARDTVYCCLNIICKSEYCPLALAQ